MANAKKALRRLGENPDARVFTREFDGCFEMGDGDAVVFQLMDAALSGDDLLLRGIKRLGNETWLNWSECYEKGREATLKLS